LSVSSKVSHIEIYSDGGKSICLVCLEKEPLGGDWDWKRSIGGVPVTESWWLCKKRDTCKKGHMHTHLLPCNALGCLGTLPTTRLSPDVAPRPWISRTVIHTKLLSLQSYPASDVEYCHEKMDEWNISRFLN
jgi:hypothetical protein